MIVNAWQMHLPVKQGRGVIFLTQFSLRNHVFYTYDLLLTKINIAETLSRVMHAHPVRLSKYSTSC